jgi:hypothetical protein
LEIVQFVGGGSAGPALAASGPVTRKVTTAESPAVSRWQPRSRSPVR